MGDCTCAHTIREHKHTHTAHLHVHCRSQQGCVVTDAAVRSGSVLVKLELLARQTPAAAADAAAWAREAYSAFAAAVQEWVQLLQLDAQLDARAPVLIQVDSVRGGMVWDVDTGMWSMADGLAPTSSAAEGEAVAHLMRISRISVACPAAMLAATKPHQQQQEGQSEGCCLSVRVSVCVPTDVVLLGWTDQEQELENGTGLGGYPLGKKESDNSSHRSSSSPRSKSSKQQRPGLIDGMAVRVLAHLRGVGYMPTHLEVVGSVPAAVAETAVGVPADAQLVADSDGAVNVQVGEDSDSSKACGMWHRGGGTVGCGSCHEKVAAGLTQGRLVFSSVFVF